MKKLMLCVSIALFLLSHAKVLAADHYQQEFLKGPNQTKTINIAAGTVAYLFGATTFTDDPNSGGENYGNVLITCTVAGITIPCGAGYNQRSATLILAGPASVTLTTTAGTHAEVAFLWTILTRPNPNINGIKQ